ncbi:unnamed protein product [Cylindrotheca closterium]|uniref:Uncharacterized protein n=1 Tax=Cylindrotheca closterium TaxID=2856 RepID=A0AAD2CT85_9STRA|nr:unnamed protein product [Cylindrotheca closterium]
MDWIPNGASAAPPGHSTNPIVMPPGGAPLSDYNTPNLQSMAFPTLFPHGVGDVTSGDRLVKVKLNQANKHLLWYCLNKADRGLAPEDDGPEFVYPFAELPKWMY